MNKYIETFDLYEQFVTNDLIKRNPNKPFNEIVQVVINMAEGDETQLSEGIKKYAKKEGIQCF